MNRAFRKDHRQIAIVLCIPLFLTVLSGMAYTIVADWFHNYPLGGLFMRVHTFNFFNLGKIYPLLNGLGLIGLLVTGLNMTTLFSKRTRSDHDQSKSEL